MLEVLKNTLHTRLYWVLFPVEDLRQAVETAKRILIKETIDRQLAGQSSSTPFMNIEDGYSSMKVTFDMGDSLDDKIDRLMSMMSKMTAQDDDQNKQLKPMIYQSKWRGITRNFYDQNYDQRNYQNRYRSNIGDRRTSYRGRGQYGQNYRGRSHYINNYRNDYRRDNFRNIQNYRGQYFRGGCRRNYRNDNFGRGRSRSRDRQYSDNIRRNYRSRSQSVLRASTNRDRIRCYNCREYDHLAKGCPTLQVEKEAEQLQQMYNIEK